MLYTNAEILKKYSAAFYLFILSVYLKFKNYLALPNFKPMEAR